MCENNELEVPPKQTLDLSLVYDDQETTPARSVPYRLVFENGIERRGELDFQGKAQELDCPICAYEIMYYPDEEVEAIERALQPAYQALDKAVWQMAEDLRDGLKSVIAKLPPPDTEDRELMQLRADLRAAAETEIAKLRERAEAYDALPWYGRSWENIKASASGVGKGVTEYLPDFGELGDLWEVMDIDVTVVIEAIATGNIDAMEKQFQEWKQRGEAGYEAANETMETLILLLSDQQTRKYLAELPQRFLLVTPRDELVEIAITQGTQVGMDIGATVGTTVAVGAFTGPGGAVAGAATFGLTTVRKGGKALEAVIDVLNKLVVLLKKKRNKTETNQSQQQTLLPRDNHSNAQNKEEGDNDSVRPTIQLEKTEPLNKSYFDANAVYGQPARITLGLAGKGKSRYQGKGQVSITSGEGKFYTDKACQQLANNTYNASALKAGKVLYVKAMTKEDITIRLALDKQANLKVGFPANQKVPVHPVNTLWAVIRPESSDVRKKSGAIQDYVAVVNASKQYDFKQAKARTYVDIIVEESNPDYPNDYNPKTVTLTGSGLNFFRGQTGAATQGKEIPYSDFNHLEEKDYKPRNSDAKAKFYRVYLEAENDSKKAVTIYAQLQESENKTYRLGQGKAKIDIQAEAVDDDLANNIKGHMGGKTGPAISQAVVHKCGKKTWSKLKTNITNDQIRNAFELFLEFAPDKNGKNKPVLYAKIDGEYVKVKAIDDHIYQAIEGDIARTTSNEPSYKIKKTSIEVIFKEYKKILEDAISQDLHPWLNSAIKSRLQDYLRVKDGFLPNDINANPTYSDKAPGFHAEVLAINELLMTYFEDSKDKNDSLRITEMTYYLKVSKKASLFQPVEIVPPSYAR